MIGLLKRWAATPSPPGPTTPAWPPLPAGFCACVLPIYKGNLSSGQSTGLRRILAGTVGFSADDRAYMLATVYHETGRTMQPVEEIGGASHVYGPKFYGRGLCQITWSYNYARFGTLLGCDLTGHPDLALTWDVALPILTLGMARGLFTGRKLGDYFGPASYGNGCNPIDARRIVNGTDRAALIASYFWVFRRALDSDGAAAVPTASA